MIHPTVEKKLIKETLTKAKTIAMVGVSFDKEEETRTSIRRRLWLQGGSSKSFLSRQKNMWRDRSC